METHVCENVHTEFILSSCYGFHLAVSMLDTESIQWLLRRTLCDTRLTTPLELDWRKRSPVNVHPLRLPFPSDTEKRQNLWPTVQNSK